MHTLILFSSLSSFTVSGYICLYTLNLSLLCPSLATFMSICPKSVSMTYVCLCVFSNSHFSDSTAVSVHIVFHYFSLFYVTIVFVSFGVEHYLLRFFICPLPSAFSLILSFAAFLTLPLFVSVIDSFSLYMSSCKSVTVSLCLLLSLPHSSTLFLSSVFLSVSQAFWFSLFVFVVCVGHGFCIFLSLALCVSLCLLHYLCLILSLSVSIHVPPKHTLPPL